MVSLNAVRTSNKVLSPLPLRISCLARAVAHQHSPYIALAAQRAMLPQNGTSPVGQFTLTDDQLEKYFARIGYGYDGDMPPANLETLWNMQCAHATAIPFENLSIVHPRLKLNEPEPIKIDMDSIFEKLVVKRRGGYCYEMNNLFAAALRTIGFDLYCGAARVVLAPAPEDGPQQLRLNDHHGHMILFVILPDGSRWLTDVGYGGRGPIFPVQVTDKPNPDPVDNPPVGASATDSSTSFFRLRRGLPYTKEEASEEEATKQAFRYGWYLQGRMGGGWYDKYFFTLQEFCYTDQVHGNFFTSTHPESLFTSLSIVSRLNPKGGRTQLVMSTLSEYQGGDKLSERQLEGEEERDKVLQEVFGLNLVP